MKELFKFIKASGVYFVGNIMIKLVSFLLLPIYTTYISTSDMGIYEVATAYVTFLCSVLFLDIWSGIMRFMFERGTREEKKDPINSGFAIFAISCALYTIIMVGVGIIFKVPYIQHIFLYELLMNVRTLFGYLARGFEKNVLYASAGLVGSLITTLCNIVLIVVFKFNYSAMFIAGCVGYIFNICIIGRGIRVWELISIKKIDKKLFRQLFFFSLPLCLNSVAYWFLTSYNRVAITNVLGESYTGLYSVAGRFGSVITLFTSCFNMAWQELSYSKEAMSESDDDFYTVAINSFIKFLGMGLVIIIPVVYFIFPIMIKKDFVAGKNMVPFYLLATIASATSAFLGNIFSAIKKNDVLFYTTVVGSVVNVILVHLLLPFIGVQGASIALFVGFFINIVIRILILKKELLIDIDIKFLCCLVVMLAAAIFTYCKLGVLWNAVMFLVGCILTVFVFKDYIRMILKNILNR